MMSYYDFMNEITSTELYERLIQHGMFSEKLPPVFTAKPFLNYCINIRTQAFEDRWYPYTVYENMRNINIPRNIGIPTPMGHERLCRCLSDNWDKIVEHFRITTENQKRIVSRIHIRKIYNTDALFEMNYKNWRIDGTPEPDIYIGKRYMVSADISKCYPSIYTHAIPWALVGKETAKSTANDDSLWYNDIDHHTQRAKNGETHGILIGPHTSNVLSEIILCAIDSKLSDRWDYVRNIDDYTCFVESKEDAEMFLIELNRELREYDLLLNHKKTEIKELPIGIVEQWVHKIQDKVTFFQKDKSYVDYKEAQAFVDFCISLMSKNHDNSSILFYALKVLREYTLTKNAQQYMSKSIVALSLIYPYLVPLLDEYIFEPYQLGGDDIKAYANRIYENYFCKDNYEACAYSILFAIKYNFTIDSFELDKIIEKKDCVLLLFALLYCKKIKWRSGVTKLKKFAKELIANNQMEEYWLFVYESLPSESLNQDWVQMKKANISFIKNEYL